MTKNAIKNFTNAVYSEPRIHNEIFYFIHEEKKKQLLQISRENEKKKFNTNKQSKIFTYLVTTKVASVILFYMDIYIYI